MRKPKSQSRKAAVETFTVTITDEAVLKSLRAIAFVAGVTIEEAILDTLRGIDDRHDCIGELHHDISGWADTGKERKAAISRLKQYRDKCGLHYPNEIIAIHEAEDAGEITAEEARRRRLAFRKLEGQKAQKEAA